MESADPHHKPKDMLRFNRAAAATDCDEDSAKVGASSKHSVVKYPLEIAKATCMAHEYTSHHQDNGVKEYPDLGIRSKVLGQTPSSPKNKNRHKEATRIHRSWVLFRFT